MASSEAESGGGPNSPGNQASGAHTSVPASMSDSKEVRRRLWQEVMKPLWPRFCETVDPADIIDVLFAHGQITSATREECTMKNTLSRDRAGMLLSALEKMGSQKAFIILVQALDRHAGPNRQLAQEIIPKAENEVSGIFQNTLGLLSPETTSACFPTERPTGSQSGRNFSRSHHVHMQRDEWEEAVPRFLGLWKKTVDAMEIADAVFEDGIITMRMLEELRKETRELIDSEKAYALLLKLQKGGSHSYERTVNILWTKGTESYRNLATKMNEEANVSMPGRNRQLEHDSQPGEQLKPDEVEWQEPKLAMDTWVIFHMKDKLCELDDLLALFRDFDFSAEENADELKRLLRDTKKPTDKAKKQFLSALLKVEKLDLKRVAKQLKQSNQRKHVEEMQELMRERRKKLESDWMVQRIYTTQQPSMSLEDATKVHYLQERPSIVCNDEARDFIRNQLSFDKSVPTPPPQQRPRDDKFSNLPCVRRDIGKHFTSERWSDNRMVVKTVAVIGSREAVQSYCRKQFKRKLTPLQLSEIWPGQRGTEGNACSTMHAIIHRSEGDNPCECYFILDLHPMDREETHCQMLHKVLNAAQSVLLLYQTHEVDADWLLANQPQSKPSLQLMTSSGLPNDNGTYTILQRAMLDRIREVFKLFPVCPIYHSVKVPATYLRIAVVANVQLANLEKRLVHANHVFEMARSKEVRQLDEKLMWEEQYHRSSQLPFVSIDSTPEMASSNPAKWCQQTQYPVCQWLDDLTTPSPVTLLAAVDRDTPLCTAFPACADEIYDETTEDDVGILFAKIQEMNLLQPSLSAREVPIRVVTCLADDRRDAFMCLNMFAGAAFPVGEDFDLKLEANGEASASSHQALCRLIGCARFVNCQVFVLLTFIGLTPTSLQGISPAQKVILLSAIALSHLFVVDARKPRSAAKALGKFIQGTLEDKDVPISTRDGSTLDRENVDRQLFHGQLLVISPLSKSSKTNQPADKQQPTAAASRRSLAVERQQSKEIDKSYFTQLHLLFDHVSFGEYEATADWPDPVIPNFQRQCAHGSRNVAFDGHVPTRSPQARIVAEANESLPDLGHFPDGKAFLARLNLLLALASHGFQSPFKLSEMFRHSTEQVRDDLHNVIVFGQAEGEATTETYSYPHLKKSMDVEVVLDTSDPVSLVQKIRLQIRKVFGGSKNRNFVRAEVQRVVKSFVKTRCKVGEEFLRDQEQRYEDRAEYISTLHEDILEFRNKWTLCGKPCSKCYMWCLLPSNHGNDHNCGSDSQGHECGIECQQPCPSENDGPASNCTNTCTALAGHEEANEEEHSLVLGDRVHRCEPFNGKPNIHMCRKECNLLGPQKCSRECQKYVDDHPEDEHDCGEAHSCQFPCEVSGWCIAGAGSVDESLAPRVAADNSKRPCAATLGPGETPGGSGKHLHECDSGNHYCDFLCKFCGKFCQLDADHLQLSPASLHQITHGLIINKRDLHVYDAYENLVDIPPDATCSTICSKTAGTGHSHILGYCTAGAACTEDSKAVRHIFLGSTRAHYAKHPEFWKREKVEEPCPGHVDDFLQCGISCGGCEDGDQRPLCSEEMWHESCRRSLGSFLMPYPEARKVGQLAIFHKFTSHMHPCLEKCQASTSCMEDCTCQIGHTCSATCPDDCPGEGDSLGKHIHSSPALHHCGRSHRCSEMCKHPGTCFLQQTMSAEPREGSLRVGSVGNAYRLPCSTNCPKGYSNHNHLDKGHSCEEPHTCEKYCRLCQKYCKLPYKHSGVCDTDHGAIVDTELLGLVIRRQNDCRVELTTGVTCTNLCQAAGPSHKHEWEFSHHRSSNLYKDYAMDEVSHSTLWERIMGFKDPHPDAEESKGFSRCPQQCTGKEHSEDADRPYCDAGLFHPKLDPVNYSHVDGYVSTENHPHHYPCTNHKCQGPCPKMDNGKKCEETCKWNADHYSRGEQKCVCQKERHHCGKQCQNPHCIRLCQMEWESVHGHDGGDHDCGEEHHGAEPCEARGKCEPTQNEATAGSIADQCHGAVQSTSTTRRDDSRSLQVMEENLSSLVEAVPTANDSDLVSCPPGNTDLAETLVIQNFSRTFSGPQGHYFRLEKAVTMGSNGGLISQPVEVNLKTNHIAASENVFLVHVEKERYCSGLWKAEHGIDETQDAAGDMFVLQPPERQSQELSFSITDEDLNCTHFPVDQQSDAFTDPYTSFVVDRENDRVLYSKTGHCIDILVVTSTSHNSKVEIADFIGHLRRHYRACRYLVYARQYHQHDVLLQVDLEDSAFGDAPVRLKPKDGFEQVGFTDNWLLLSLDRHRVTFRFILDRVMKGLWSHKIEYLVDKKTSIGITVIVERRRSSGTAPSQLFAELEVYGICQPREGTVTLRSETHCHMVRGRVEYDGARRESLMPTKANPPTTTVATPVTTLHPALATASKPPARSQDSELSEDPWKHVTYKHAYPWLIQSMDPHNVRTLAFAQSLITPETRDVLLVQAIPRAHNESLLACLEKDGRRSFVGFLQVLGAMGPAFEETCRKLALSITRNEASVIDSDKPTDQSVPHMVSAGQSGGAVVQEPTQGTDSKHDAGTNLQGQQKQEKQQQIHVTASQVPSSSVGMTLDTSVASSPSTASTDTSGASTCSAVELASCYRAALEMHYEVIEQCADFDPVRCARHLRSKRYFATPVVKSIEQAKAADGQAEASASLVTHLSELSDNGVLYFVEQYLTWQGLEDVAATIRLCPGPSDCTLEAADHHRISE